MTQKLHIGIWIIAIALSVGFLIFGLSDFMTPRKAYEYSDRNPFRPFFRLGFGIVMVMLLNYAAIAVTARIRQHCK